MTKNLEDAFLRHMPHIFLYIMYISCIFLIYFTEVRNPKLCFTKYRQFVTEMSKYLGSLWDILYSNLNFQAIVTNWNLTDLIYYMRTIETLPFTFSFLILNKDDRGSLIFVTM